MMMIALALFCAVQSFAISLPFDKYTINRENLPQEAREMLDEYFPKAKVSMIKVDKHLLKKTDYDVKLTNGTKIEFDNKGKWTSVDCKKREVPSALIKKNIRNHVSKNYPDVKIVKIKKKLSGFELGLSCGRELKYDLLGSFRGEKTNAEKEAEKAAEAEEETDDAVTSDTQELAEAIAD